MIIQLKPRRDVKMKQANTYNRDEEGIVINSIEELQVYGLAMEMQNYDHRLKGYLVVDDMQKLEQPAEKQKEFLGSASILDRSELEKIAERKELTEMENDGLYVKMSVEYDAKKAPVLKAKRWDGKETSDVIQYVAHYVDDVKQRGGRIPAEVGFSIVALDKKSMADHYGAGLADKLRQETLKLMAGSEGLYKVA